MFFWSPQDQIWYQKLVPSAGPLPGIFALYMVYWLVIPVCRPYAYGVLGIDFSEKAPIYLLGVQLFFFGGWNSILPSIVGILCGAAWISNIRGVQGVRIPLLKSLVNDWIVFIRKVEASSTAAASIWGAIPHILNTRNLHVSIQEQPVVPLGENIENLMSMGFDRTVASGALIRSRDNVQVAIDSLLYHPTLSRSNNE
eukprot:538966_1